jgi:hypothetical protein
MQLYQWLIWNFAATARLRAIDKRLDARLLESVLLLEPCRKRLAGLMVNTLPEVIHDYDFSRGFYAQFVTYSSKNSASHMAKVAAALDKFQDNAVADKDAESTLMFELIKLFVLLFAFKTQSAYAMRLRGRILAVRAKNMNDIVQYFLATRLSELQNR